MGLFQGRNGGGWCPQYAIWNLYGNCLRFVAALLQPYSQEYHSVHVADNFDVGIDLRTVGVEEGQACVVYDATHHNWSDGIFLSKEVRWIVLAVVICLHGDIDHP